MDKRSYFIFRRKNPRFFSIEKVFGAVMGALHQWEAVPVVVPEYGISIWNMLFLFRLARKDKQAIFHVTGDNTYLALALPRRRTVVTFHDLVFLGREKGLKRAILKWLLLDLPVWWCRKVTVISEATRAELLSNVHCDPAKITMVPNPLVSSIEPVEKVFNAEEPRLLFVGVTDNKNLERTAKAISGIRCKLVILGEPDPGQISVLRAADISFEYHKGLSEQEVAQLYQGSDLVLYPSLYEGFGLPILEGFQAGRPVITSDREPMRSVAGNAALLVDPLQEQEIRSAVIEICQDAERRRSMVEAGFLVLSKYAPELVAGLYENVYQSMVKA